MKNICRTALLASLAFIAVSPSTAHFPSLFAGTPPSSTSKIKKNKKHKRNKVIVLKKHRAKQAKKPA
jgi:hypothetical protein